MRNINNANVKIFFSLFTEIKAIIRYAFDGTEFRNADNYIQFLKSDDVSMQAIEANLSISINVNDTTCFQSISLRYWCDDNTPNDDMNTIEQGCIEDDKFLDSKWIINCPCGGFEYSFVSDKTISHVLYFKTICKYFIVVVCKYIFIMIGMFV